MLWRLLVISLPTRNATVRQRTWRTLKGIGAAALRDGVYLLPEQAAAIDVLESVASEVRRAGGSSHILRTSVDDDAQLQKLFNRAPQFDAVVKGARALAGRLSIRNLHTTQRGLQRLQREFASVLTFDFFPGAARQQAQSALQELEQACQRLLTPDEPHARSGKLETHRTADFRGRIWATRRRPWVDRLASAWLILRFIDPKARLLWMADVRKLPKRAVGFDFDGAQFSHLGGKVTFEVLAASFGVEEAGVTRLGMLIHFLDVGGIEPPEAPGIKALLEGLRQTHSDDDALLAAVLPVFDGLLTRFKLE